MATSWRKNEIRTRSARWPLIPSAAMVASARRDGRQPGSTYVVDVPGGRLRAGGTAVLLIAAANRDEAEHRDPLTFDPERTDAQHLSFSGGIHYCLGAPLARLEGRVVLAELARRLVDPRIDELEYRENRVLRGPSRLVVGFDALLP